MKIHLPNNQYYTVNSFEIELSDGFKLIVLAIEDTDSKGKSFLKIYGNNDDCLQSKSSKILVAGINSNAIEINHD